jgi:hypothetical protein
MTPTRKGLYKECINCKFKLNYGKYPCSKSHKEVRQNSNGIGIQKEIDFEFCGLLNLFKE